eukprot:7968633-Pyramimonas_sp.AAC.1
MVQAEEKIAALEKKQQNLADDMLYQRTLYEYHRDLFREAVEARKEVSDSTAVEDYGYDRRRDLAERAKSSGREAEEEDEVPPPPPPPPPPPAQPAMPARYPTPIVDGKHLRCQASLSTPQGHITRGRGTIQQLGVQNPAQDGARRGSPSPARSPPKTIASSPAGSPTRLTPTPPASSGLERRTMSDQYGGQLSAEEIQKELASSIVHSQLVGHPPKRPPPEAAPPRLASSTSALPPAAPPRSMA